jgi:ABC-type oligopeptide transport system substrate-binding subunit
VTVEPVLVEPYNYLDELYAGNTGNIFSSGWCADYPDPENFLDLLFHTASAQNLSGYHNGEIDALLEEARTESDVGRRLTLYQEIERLIVADAPVVFVAHSLSAVLVKPELQGYVLTPIGVAQWHLVSKER